MSIPLIIGGDSIIGSELIRQYNDAGMSVLATTRRKETISDQRIWLDLSEDIQSWRPPRNASRAFLCAATTSIDRCRIDPTGTTKMNVTNTMAIARRLLDEGCFVVFLSTNLVFDGSVPFRQAGEKTCPVTEYGWQKAQVEETLLQSGATAAVRLTKTLSTPFPLFMDWCDHLRRGETVYPYSNVAFSPIPLSFAARVLREVAGREVPGIVQVSADRDITYEDAAVLIAKHLGVSRNLVQAVRKEEGLACSTLAIDQLQDLLGMTPPAIESTITVAAGL